MSPSIHPTAIISPDCQLGEDVVVGPYAVLDACIVGDRCRIEAHAQIYSRVRLGEDCHIWNGAVVGADPQDRKYAGEESFLEVGSQSVVREYATLNRGTAGGTTQVGKRVLVMAYAHVAHDCYVGKGAVLANGVQLGGHVEVGAHSVLGGLTAVHQFCKVGECSYVGGTLKVDRHVPPFSRAFGNPLRWAGINRVGMERLGFSREEVRSMERVLKKIFREKSGDFRLFEDDSGKSGAKKKLLNFLLEQGGNILSAK